jgi:lipoprotein-anchoring transpeptidase ErfK/SrfK
MAEKLRHSARSGAAIVSVVLLAAGCGRTVEQRQDVAGARKTVVHRCASGTQRSLGTRLAAVAAIVVRPTTAFRTPGSGSIARFTLKNVNGAPTVFGVLGERLDGGCNPTWLHVQLPLRPNGATGWVRANDVVTAPVQARIAVDLSERVVRLYEHGRLVLRSRAAVGSAATPTPVGRYYVNQRLIPADPNGPFGPGAVGISAFSPVLTGWAQGGPIAIHGTNEPWSIGHAVSNGCIRVPNAVLRRMWNQTPAGTPVEIRR